MTDYSSYTSKYIENKIGLNLKTLNSLSIGDHKKYSDIYSLTSHEYRYSGLSMVLKLLSIPLVAVSNVIKILSHVEVIAVKEMVNIPLILLKKMDQNIAKKILEGLGDTTQEELSDITNSILKQWKQDNTLIPQEEDSIFTRFKNYVFDNLPFITSIKNFWVNGGIHYTKQQLDEQHLVKKITKEIFKICYITGKEAQALSSNDIYNHFKEIGAYKDDVLSNEIDLFKSDFYAANYDIRDEGYCSDNDTANLIGEDNKVD